MRVLIVGVDGQDGRVLWQQLERQGCILLGVSRSGTKALRCEWTRAVDIGDEGDVRRLINTFRPNQVYYLAAHHHSSENPQSQHTSAWQYSWKIHVEAFRHFLEVMRTDSITTRVFFASSSRIFGLKTK